MELIDQLIACRDGAAQQVAIMEALIERFTRLTTLVAPAGPGAVKTNGHPRLLPSGKPNTRGLVLAAASDWATSRIITARVVAGGGKTATAASMIKYLVSEGILKRRGTSRGSYEYRAKG